MKENLNTSVLEAVQAFKSGEIIIVADNSERENECDLIQAAEFVTKESMAFMISNTSGIICAPMTASRAEYLNLPLMVKNNTESMRTAFTVSVDAKGLTTTGVSAADRSATVKALVDLDSKADDFLRPGHIFPLIAKSGGVLSRPGHTEAAIDLANMSNIQPMAILAEVANPDGSIATSKDIDRLSAKYNLVSISVDDLVVFRRSNIDLNSLAPVNS